MLVEGERLMRTTSSVERDEIDPLVAISASRVYRVYWYRWLYLGIYFAMTAANNMLLTTFGTIDKVTGMCFQQSSLAVNSMAGAFAITGVLLLFPGLWVLKVKRPVGICVSSNWSL